MTLLSKLLLKGVNLRLDGSNFDLIDLGYDGSVVGAVKVENCVVVFPVRSAERFKYIQCSIVVEGRIGSLELRDVIVLCNTAFCEVEEVFTRTGPWY